MFGPDELHKDYYYPLLGRYDQTSKLIDSSANRGLVIADTNSLVTRLATILHEVEGQGITWPIRWPLCQYSLQRKMGFDASLYTTDRSYVMWFPNMTMADEEIPHQLFKLPRPIAPSNT